MTTRLERVVLDLEDRLSDDMLRAAAATGVLRHELERLDGTSARANTSQRELGGPNGSIAQTSRRMDEGGKSIDRYSGRLGLLGDAVLGLGPAAVTSAAVAVPAVASVASELGFLVAGVGTTKLAFNGFGDALTKFNRAALDPTAANIKAAQLAMDKLPPSAQRLVLQLHHLGPEVERLQKAAGIGLFPGVSDGLHAIIQDAPIARRGLHDIGYELGGLARDAGRSLASDKWRPFLRFLGREAPASIDATTRAAGHGVHGLAELWMAFEPVNHDLDAGILRVAQDFDRWATSLGRTKDFQAFLDYYRQNGPRVLELLGQTADTLISVGEAAAPVGAVVVPVLTEVLKIVDAIASSDFGTPLLGGLLVFRLYARTMQMLGVQVETSWKGIATAPAQVQTKITDLAATTRTSVRSMMDDFRAMSLEYQRDARSIQTSTRSLFPSSTVPSQYFNPLNTIRTAEQETKAVGRVKSSYLSLFSGTSAAAQRTRARIGEVVKGGAQLAGIGVVATGVADKVGLANASTLGLLGTLAGPWGATVGGAVGLTLDFAHANDTLVASQNRAKAAFSGGSVFVDFQQQAAALAEFTKQNAAYQTELSHTWGGGSHNPLQLTKEGLTQISDLFTHSGEEADAARQKLAQTAAQDRTTFSKIFEGLNGPAHDEFGRDMLLTIPQLQQVANRAQPAMLALGITVDDLRAAAERNDGSLEHMTGQIVHWINFSDSAQGRTVAVAKAFAQMADETLTTDDRVQALTQSLDALLGPTLGLSEATDQYTSDLHSLRSELAKGSKTLVGNSNAALTNRAAIRSRVTDLSNLIKAEATAGESPEKMTASLKRQRAALIEAGVAAGMSRGQLEAYLNKLGLTPKLVRTAIELAGTSAAEAALQNLTRDRVIHIVAKVDHLGVSDTTGTGGRVLTGNGDGGTIPKTGRPYADRHLRLLADGEEVISNRYGQADRWRPLLKAINAGMADGGTVTRALMTRSSAQRVRVDFGQVLVNGSIGTPFGSFDFASYVEAKARDVYNTERDRDMGYDRAMSGG